MYTYIRLTAAVDIEKPCHYCGSRHWFAGIYLLGAVCTTSAERHCIAALDIRFRYDFAALDILRAHLS